MRVLQCHSVVWPIHGLTSVIPVASDWEGDVGGAALLFDSQSVPTHCLISTLWLTRCVCRQLGKNHIKNAHKIKKNCFHQHFKHMPFIDQEATQWNKPFVNTILMMLNWIFKFDITHCGLKIKPVNDNIATALALSDQETETVCWETGLETPGLIYYYLNICEKERRL